MIKIKLIAIIITVALFFIVGASFLFSDPANLIHDNDKVKTAGWIVFGISLSVFLGYVAGLRVGYDDGLFKSITNIKKKID